MYCSVRRIHGRTETPVDLRTHDLTVGRWMVVAAEQRTGQVHPGLSETLDLLVEGGEALRGDGLPVGDVGGIEHLTVRHEEGATHMADGWSRTTGKVGVAIGTSGPAGTNMITGLYTAIADSVPIVCITGQQRTDLLDKEGFQAVDIVDVAKPVTKWAVQVREAAQVPWTFREAFRTDFRGIALGTAVPLASFAMFHMVTVFPLSWMFLHTDDADLLSEPHGGQRGLRPSASSAC